LGTQIRVATSILGYRLVRNKEKEKKKGKKEKRKGCFGYLPLRP
jgi:hypothetical protein